MSTLTSNMSNDERLNLLLLELAPYERKINGHRLVPVKASSGFWCWSTKPNRSTYTFYFPRLSLAEAFCKRYSNNHGYDFWFNRYSFVYQLGFFSSTLSELDYQL